MKNQIIALAILASATAASASITDLSQGKISAKLSTLGVGVEYTYAINDNTTVRAGYSTASIDGEGGSGIKMTNFSFIGDYHPGGGIVRLSAGVVNMDGELSVTQEDDAITGLTTIEGQSITTTLVDSVQGKLNFGGTLPYVGVGLAKSPSEDGFGMSLDFGVVSPKFTPALEVVKAATNTTAENTAVDDFVTAVNAELEKEKISGVYPVISAGVSYSF